MRVHLDTDFAGDTDDAAALAMLLGWPDVDVVGITTAADPDGRRAGYVHSLLALARRDVIPVAAGAGTSLGGDPMGALPAHYAYWGETTMAPRPSLADAGAVELLAKAVEREATIIAIGPYTNLAHLETARPGILESARIVLMGGWVQPPPDGFPRWGADWDWNVQCDTTAMLQVYAAAGELTLVTLAATLQVHLRGAHLERLEASGPVGRLLALQGRAHAAEYQLNGLGRAHPALPDDLLNFQHDPLACAVALGWEGAVVTPMTLRPVVDSGILRFETEDHGRMVDVVSDVDGPAFADVWLAAVERADRRH